MATYTIKPNQNIWDVAIDLYGSIEGVFDLLISNDTLGFDTNLKSGDTLEYHDYFVINSGIVKTIKENGYLPANGARSVYNKITNEKIVFYCILPYDEDNMTFAISGGTTDGDMYIDWGDNTNIEHVALTSVSQRIEHYFNNSVEERRVKIYGDFDIISLDMTGTNAVLLVTNNVTIDEFAWRKNTKSLDGLFLFDNIYKIDLRDSYIEDLSPIYDKSLEELDLRGVDFKDVSVIDNYLQNIVSNYGSRRDCVVRLTSAPSAIGMAAISTIINEESWNESGYWKFYINDQLYTSE